MSGAENLDVERLVARIRQEGSYDSGGRFTLDSTLLHEKLARYRLTNPWKFLWYAVRAGVAGGASRVSIRTIHTSTEAVMDIPPLQLGDIARLSNTVLLGSQDRTLSHLALAFESAVGLKQRISALELSSGRPEETSPCLKFVPSGQVELCGQIWRHSEPGACLSVTYPFWRCLWNAMLEGWHTALCFQFTGIPVTSGKSIRNLPPGAVALKAGLQEGLFEGQWSPPGGDGPDAWHVVALAPTWQPSQIPYGGLEDKARHVWLMCSQPDSPPTFCLTGQGAVVPWLRLQGQPAVGAWAVLWECDDLIWVLDGVEVERETTSPLPEMNCRWGGVAVADGLQLDLDGFLVRDQAYRDRMTWLEQMLRMHAGPLNQPG